MGRPISSGEIRIGIVGAGQITRTRHFPGFRAIPGVRIVGGLQPPPRIGERGSLANSTFPRSMATGRTWSPIPSVDAVVIGAWPYLHCPVTLAAFDAGKHVLTQARMALNAREAQRMHDRALESPAADRDDRAQSLRPDGRRLHALADRLGLSRANSVRSTSIRSTISLPTRKRP